MQHQLRALWVDQPPVNMDLPDQALLVDPATHNSVHQTQPAIVEERTPDLPVAGPRHGADEADDAVPAPRQSPEEDENDDEELSER
jgi:hypothetical protein